MCLSRDYVKRLNNYLVYDQDVALDMIYITKWASIALYQFTTPLYMVNKKQAYHEVNIMTSEISNQKSVFCLQQCDIAHRYIAKSFSKILNILLDSRY